MCCCIMYRYMNAADDIEDFKASNVVLMMPFQDKLDQRFISSAGPKSHRQAVFGMHSDSRRHGFFTVRLQNSRTN